MRITQITYSALRSNGNYSNDKVEATSELVEGDNPDDSFKSLQTYVEKALGQQGKYRTDVADAQDKLQQLKWENDKLTRENERLEFKIVNMKNFLDRHGVKVNLDNIDVPF